MYLREASEIKAHLEEEFLVRHFRLTKSASVLEGFQVSNYVRTYESINGIGIGYGGRRDAYYTDIMLREEVEFDLTSLAKFFGVTPESFRVRYVGEIQALQTTARHRPAFPGVSIGHYKISAGTFGCLVEDENGGIHILSNNHVLANLNSASLGDSILQPGPHDGGNQNQDTIAQLSEYIPIDFQGLNRVDAALAEPLNYSDVLPDIPHIGHVAGTANPRLNIRVLKFGRTTGITFGVLIARNATIKVNMGGREVLFEDQIVITSDQGRFSGRGDSGSLILDIDRYAIGLLFAGSTTGVTFANPIGDVLTRISVKIIQNGAKT